jgi:hypothetical protein
MKATERRAFFYDVLINKRAAHAHTPSLIDLLTVWKSGFDNGNCSHEREKGNLVYRIRDIEIDLQSKVAILLIDKADKTAADAAYSDVQTGQLTVFHKTSNQGSAHAAHLFLSLGEEHNRPGAYLALLEGVPGISHRHIQPLLNSIVRDACDRDPMTFSYEDPVGAKSKDGHIRKHPFTPLIELRGHPSQDIINDIEHGKIQHLELTSDRRNVSLANDPYLQEKRHVLRISVDSSIPTAGRLQRIIDAMQTKKSDYLKGRIAFVDRNGQNKVVEYDLDTGSPEQGLYLKSVVVNGLNPPLAQSSEKIVPHFAQQIVAHLKNDRTWQP